MKILTYGLIALTVFLWLFVVLRFLMKRRRSVNQRLVDIQRITGEVEEATDLSTLKVKPTDQSALYGIPLIGSYLENTSIQMIQAHLWLKPSEFLLISLSAAGVLFLIFYLVTGNPLIAILLAAIGFWIPKLYVTNAQTKRKNLLSNQLPEFLNILSNALRAGLSFNQAIATAGNEMADPIRWEFQKVIRDNGLGKPMEEALLDLAQRSGDEDMDMLVSAVIIQRQVGGNMSEVLDMIAHTIRDRVKLKGEIRTMTAQNKLSALIIGLLPVAIGLILTVMNPGYMKPLLTDFPGQLMIGLAVFMMVIGALILKKITTLEV